MVCQPGGIGALCTQASYVTALAQNVVGAVVGSLVRGERTCECKDALGAALITQRDVIPPETIEELGPIVSRYLT